MKMDSGTDGPARAAMTGHRADGRAGTVTMTAICPHPREEVWAALTEPARVRRWFATLDGGYTPDALLRADFGDGDFFLVRVRRVAPPRSLEFDWSFLGVGPVERIAFRLAEDGPGCLVEVTDSDPDRGEEAARSLAEGWGDFLARLRRHLDTGEDTRYGWRGEIDAVTDLPASANPLRDPDRLRVWLPLSPRSSGACRFLVGDDTVPREFEVDELRLDGDRLDFLLGVRGLPGRTRCRVTLEPRGSSGGLRLTVHHAGWRDLGLPDDEARRLRARFTAAWRDALDRARSLAVTAGRGEAG